MGLSSFIEKYREKENEIYLTWSDLAIVVFFLIQTVMPFPYGLIFGFVFAVAISFALFSLFTGDGNPAFTSGIQLDDLDHVDDLDGKNVKIYDKVIDKVN